MRHFSFFRPEDEVRITERNLPHWEQPHVCYFLTYRTMDSIPKEVMDAWIRERSHWLTHHGIEVHANEDWHSRLELLTAAERAEFHGHFSTQLQDYLDQGHGQCVLRRATLRHIVAESLRCFDEERYRLGGFVIMPNHVHVLVQCLGSTRVKPMGNSWKRYTACEINKRLGRSGHFWQGESHDHIVRSPQQFWHYRRYIEENPAKAHLNARHATVFLPEVDVPV
jgi:REP element-mobilizing transposase RayT